MLKISSRATQEVAYGNSLDATSQFGEPATIGLSAVALRTVVLACCFAVWGCGDRGKSPAHEPVEKKPNRAQQQDVKPQRKTSSQSQGDPSNSQRQDQNNDIQRAVVRPPQTTQRPNNNRETPAAKIFRPIYKQPSHNSNRIKALGFHQFSTSHVELITDLEQAKATRLLTAVEELHPFLEEYFGPLPPARNGGVYHVTGYLMVDRDKFFASGLAQEKQVGSFHGRQIGAEFWLNNQTLDYYRRHLLLHEIIHCYMRHLANNSTFPLWYMEGMAEMIATHCRHEDGQSDGGTTSSSTELKTENANAGAKKIEFNVMPRIRSRFTGLERIIILQRDIKKNGVRTLGQITSFDARSFRDVEAYAWCWALCRFLDSHPAYQRSFRELAKTLGQLPFDATLNSLYAKQSAEFATEWALFVDGIEHGYDFDRAAINFKPGTPLVGTVEASVDSARGWQSSGITVQQGTTYSIKSTGQFSIADRPQPWISEANGVSIRFINGRPIGQLMGAIQSGNAGVVSDDSMLREFSLGNATTFKAETSGTLYLRVNEHWGELADNKGQLQVSITEAK